MDGQTLAAAIALSRGSGGGSFAPDINDPQDGDTLVYDGTEQKWVNGSGGGSGGGLLAVHADQGVLDKTWKEIYDALGDGKYVSIVYSDESEYSQTKISSAYMEDGNYYISTTDDISYSTDSENGYPSVVNN